MANYYCSARSNYFRVNDEAAFRIWAASHEVEIVTSPKHPGMFALLANTESGAFPWYDDENDAERDFAAELSRHLAEGSVAVLLEAGAEKLRYIHGHAIAIDAEGEREQLFLDDIYEMAARRFPLKEVTRAEW